MVLLSSAQPWGTIAEIEDRILAKVPVMPRLFRAPRPGRLLLVLGMALLLVFAVLVLAMRFYVAGIRFLASQDLLAELAEAEFIDEPRSVSWPQWRGEFRNGISDFEELVTSWPGSGPRRVWSVRGVEGHSSFAVTSGKVYSMVAQEAEEAVVCWDLSTGQEQWRYRYEAGRTFPYGSPLATPTVVGNRLYTLTTTGVLLCLEVQKGELCWKQDLIQELRGESPRWGFAGSPLVDGDLVFTTTGSSRGKCLAAFHKDSGELVWASESDPAGYSSPVAMTMGEVRQVVFFTGARLLGVAAADGKRLWEYPWQTPFEVNAATPIVFRTRWQGREQQYVFISSGYEKGSALVKIEKQADRFLARRVYETAELCCHFSSPVRRGDHLYGLDEKRDLTCVNLRTGEVCWRFDAGAEETENSVRRVAFKKGALIRVKEVLVVLGEDGKLALVRATPERYEEIVSYRLSRDRCWALPALAEGKLLLRDRRQIFCLEMKKPVGQPRIN